jgi:hemin uptake protein HemP
MGQGVGEVEGGERDRRAESGRPDDRREPAERDGAAPRRWSSSELLAGGQEAEIEHQGGLYRLRRTRNGGLLLTK